MTELSRDQVDSQVRSVQRRILRGSVSQLFVRLYSICLLLVLNGLAARALSTEQFAQWLVSTNLIMIISLVAMGGMNQAIVNVVAGRREDQDDASALISRCWRIAGMFIVGTTGTVGALFVLSGLDWLQISPGLVFATLTAAALVAIHRLVASTLRSLHRVAIANLIDGPAAGPVPNSVLLVVMAIAANQQRNAEYYLWVFCVALAAMLPVSWWLIKVAIGEHVKSKSNVTEGVGDTVAQAESASFFYYTLPFLISQTLTYFSTQFDVLIARSNCDALDTSLYGAARRLGLQVAMPWQIIGASSVSSMAQLWAKGNLKGLENTMRSSATVGCLLTLPLLLVCTLLPQQVLKIIYGSEFGAASSVLIIICLGQAINCITGQCVILLMMTGHARHVIVSKLIAALVLALGGLWAVRGYGVVGLATVSALVLAVENLHLCYVAKQKSGFWTFPKWSLKRRQSKVGVGVKGF